MMLQDKQYNWVTSSRDVLLQYCNTLSAEHFIMDHSSFGRGSVRNLLVHIGNTYEFWIGRHGLNKSIAYRAYTAVNDVHEASAYFESINMLMQEFLATHAASPEREIEIHINDKKIHASPLKLFTHVITHEFHHKGQILSLTRHLGYVPVDTDIIR